MRDFRPFSSARLCDQAGFGLVEVMIAVALIVATSVTGAFRIGDVAPQRLQAAQLLATELSSVGYDSVTVTEVGTTFHVTVSPSTCAAGATETATATWRPPERPIRCP
jgi:prepilin-type N-terminal cleavage/methylation domain-containing protein